jgi:hypothetical protein
MSETRRVKKPTHEEIVEILEFHATEHELSAKDDRICKSMKRPHRQCAAIYREAIRRLNEHEKQRRRK